MRRIFGGTSITGSSTSNSLASDALPSPTASSQDRPWSPTPTHDLAPGIDGQNETRKGWFGALGGGLARSTSASSVASRGGASTTGASAWTAPAGASRLADALNLEAEDDFDFGQLPFGQARSPPPPTSPPHVGRQRDSAYSSVSGGFGALQHSVPFSPEGEPAPVSTDSLMIELLSGAAVLEAKGFEVLSWDDMQEVKKDHAVLATRIANLTRSVALETRLRDSAAKLVRLSAPSSGAPAASNPASPARPRVTREQAEAQLATAQAKLDALQSDLYKLSSRESELQTRLLRHTVAVLATSLRQKEQEERGQPTPSAAHALSPALATFSAASQRRDTPSPPGSNRFDGAHFFAGNREAIVPRARTISANGAGSPYASPQIDASGSFGANAVQLQHDLAERDAKIRELEGQASARERQLDEVKQRAEADVRALRDELERASEAAKEETERARRALSSAQAEVEGVREELHAAREDVGHAQRDAEDARHEADEARREVEEHRLSAEEARREADDHRSQLAVERNIPSTASQRDIDAARQESQDSARKLRDLGMELAEAEHKLSEAEERVSELEEELQRTEEEMKDERRSWEEKLREAESAAAEASRSADADSGRAVEDAKRRIAELETERRSVIQAIGDVLRRHRTRPTLGVVLRDSPSFDDTTERDDLPSYLASTLDAHFDRAGSHVASLTTELSALQDQHHSRAGLGDELAHAQERAQALEGDIASLQAERESLETELDLLRSQTQDHEARLATMPAVEAELATAQVAASRAQSELSSAQARVAELEGQVAGQDKTHARLQELWSAIPPLDGHARANSQSDNLTVLRSAFDPASSSSSRPFPTYSVDALVERVKVLLAEDKKLVHKLVVFEGERGDAESQKKKVKELEERIEVSANQEVSLLERLNDLTESLEQTRGEKRKLETQLRTLEADKTALEERFASAQHSAATFTAPSSSAHEGELQELRDQIADLEEELADAQRREQKTRSQLLDELSGVQGELSATKTKLRQAERKLGSKA